MSKLHELLAVMTDLETTAKKVMDEASVTFMKKQTHFSGSHKTLKMIDDERAPEAEGQEVYSALVTTVPDKLTYVRGAQEKWYDACLQQEATNQTAVADLVVDGVEIGKGLPATFLLGMEARLRRLRAVVEAAPTHDPTYEWVEAPDQGRNVYASKHPLRTQKTEKRPVHKEIVKATKEHPAQVASWNENVVVGTFTTKIWTGTISPGEKSEILGRMDTMIRAVKKARQRANSAEVVKKKIGKKILDFVLGD